MGSRAGSDRARDRLLASHGCPTTQRVSTLAMGRIAYGLGLAGVSWAGALIAELEPRTVSVYHGSPSPRVVALRHALDTPQLRGARHVNVTTLADADWNRRLAPEWRS